ncbi:MAG: hypothetical protein ACE14S_01055 [Candidatus Bathyarchaeia archaeon]
MKLKLLFPVVLIAVVFLSPMATIHAQTTQKCEQCGMNVPADAQAHFQIVDGTGKIHYSCCIKCCIKLIPKNDALNITTNCDWLGPNYVITIVTKDHLSSVTVTPETAMIIDGTCTKNRVVYNLEAAYALIANGGSSNFLIASQRTVVPPNATVMTLLQAVKTFGVAPSPSPSPSASPSASPSSSVQPTATPSPTPAATPVSTPSAAASSSPTPTVQPGASPSPSPSASAAPTQASSPAATVSPSVVPTQQCELCGMEVTPADQVKFKATDGTGAVHYVECFMCALNLLKFYETVHIETYCDWNGPSSPVVVDSRGFGASVTVTPSTAMYLWGGTCMNNRVAVDQAAADELRVHGFSQWTGALQQEPLPADVKVTTVAKAAAMYVPSRAQESGSIVVPVAVAAVVIVFVGAGIFLFQRRRR